MNATQHTPHRPGMILACGILVFAVSAHAKKPPTPPPEPPPPAGPAYRIIAVDGEINPWSLSDSGALVGSAWYAYDGGGFQTPAALWADFSGEALQYPPAYLELLPDIDGSQAYGECIAMNGTGVAVGYVMDGGIERALLWLGDGTSVDLGVDPTGIGSTANDISQEGLVLVGIGREGDPGPGGGVVVPLDVNGEPGTWFSDDDADGINDLFFPIERGNTLLPLKINGAGEVLASGYGSYLLIPDAADADGDGNPWFAEDGSGFNALMVPLAPPVPGDSVAVADLNNLGQVAGQSAGHVVRWDFVGGLQNVTDLGTLGDKIEMTATGISDEGIIVGTSRIPTGRRSKDGPSWLIEGDTLYELEPLLVNGNGWSDLEAEGMNRFGWIHGRGVLDGYVRRFVAIPAE
jgi:hypothetical protein